MTEFFIINRNDDGYVSGPFSDIETARREADKWENPQDRLLMVQVIGEREVVASYEHVWVRRTDPQ